MKVDSLVKDIFIELLRSYHNGVAYGDKPPKEVAHHLARDAYIMATEFNQTIDAIKETPQDLDGCPW